VKVYVYGGAACNSQLSFQSKSNPSLTMGIRCVNALAGQVRFLLAQYHYWRNITFPFFIPIIENLSCPARAFTYLIYSCR